MLPLFFKFSKHFFFIFKILKLTKEDYVNVICARASHWNEVGKWFFYETQVMSCQADSLVPATNAHRKDLIEKVMHLKPGGTSEFEYV